MFSSRIPSTILILADTLRDQATNPPTIKVSPGFAGLGVISSDVYIDGGDGASWYINQSNFYRQIRNFIIDMTSAPLGDYVAGIHWQVAQATSLQNIKFRMSTVAGNNQQVSCTLFSILVLH